MKEKILKTLSPLVGLELTRSTRAANMECLKFGEYFIEEKGEQWNIGILGLHLQCPWRIIQNEQLFIGSFDVYEPVDPNAPYDSDFDWDKANGNLRDKKIQDWISQTQLIVKEVFIDGLGGFELIFNQGFRLQTFPMNSSKNKYNEYWRLLDNRTNPAIHYVLDSEGFLVFD